MKKRDLMFADELESQDSRVLAVMKYYGSPLTRDEYLAVLYLGEVDPEEEIPDDVEETFPEQFRREALVETPPVSEKVQEANRRHAQAAHCSNTLFEGGLQSLDTVTQRYSSTFKKC